MMDEKLIMEILEEMKARGLPEKYDDGSIDLTPELEDLLNAAFGFNWYRTGA